MQLSHTQKSRLDFMFLKSPPTIAARWMTWVGRCFSNTAIVSSVFLNRGHKNQKPNKNTNWIVSVTIKTGLLIIHSKKRMFSQEVGIFGREEYPFFPLLGSPLLVDHVLYGPADQAGPSCHQHPHWNSVIGLTAHLEKVRRTNILLWINIIQTKHDMLEGLRVIPMAYCVC